MKPIRPILSQMSMAYLESLTGAQLASIGMRRWLHKDEPIDKKPPAWPKNWRPFRI